MHPIYIYIYIYIYIGQTYRYSPDYCFYVFSQQIYLIIFFRLSLTIFVYPSLQNVVYFLILPFLVHKIFTFYINGVLNRKCPAPGPQGQRVKSAEHVSGDNFAHPQEHWTVFTACGIKHRRCCLQAVTVASSCLFKLLCE